MNRLSRHKSSDKEEQNKKARVNFSTLVIIVCITIIVTVVTLTTVFFHNTVTDGAESLLDNYNASLAAEREAAYEQQYQKYFDAAEAKYHVSNQVSISVDNIQMTQKLEVLKVSTVVFIVEDKKDNDGNVTSWLSVPGEGTYVVDLQAAEFIVDKSRAYVLVRAPYPELTNVKILYGNVDKVLFQNDIFDDSYKLGEDIAKKQLDEADLLINKEFASNQNFSQSAEKAAISSIQCLVKKMNPGVEDIVVDVEFY